MKEIVVLRKALTQVEHHQAKLKEDMVYARGEVMLFLVLPIPCFRVKSLISCSVSSIITCLLKD